MGGWCNRFARVVIQTGFLICLACSETPDDPESLFAQTVRARAQLENGHAKAARKLLSDVAMSSQDAEAFTNLGLAYRQEGQAGRAESAWLRSLELEPANPRACYLLAELYHESVQTVRSRSVDLSDRARRLLEEAAGLLQRAAANDAHNAVIPHLLEQVHLELGDSTAAAAAGREAARLDPRRAGTDRRPFQVGQIRLPEFRRAPSINQTPPQFRQQTLEVRALGAAIFDVDDDHQLDLILQGSHSLVRNERILAPQDVQWRNEAFMPQRVSLAHVAAFDADSSPDVIVITHTEDKRPEVGRRTHVWFVRGGHDSSLVQELAVLPYEVVDLEALDVDQDADLDVIVATSGTPGLRIWRNEGAGRFEMQVEGHDFSSRTAMQEIEGADFDGDSVADFVAIDAKGQVSVWGGRGQGRFVDLSNMAGLGGKQAHVARWADLDADGCIDLLLGDDEGLWIYANRGAGRFERQAVYRDLESEWSGAPERGTPVAEIHVADLDNDGLVDLLTENFAPRASSVASRQGGQRPAEDTAPARRDVMPLLAIPPRTRLTFWRNEGAFVLTEMTFKVRLDELELFPSRMSSADFDQDGDLDLACVGADSLLRILWNEDPGLNRGLEVELQDAERPGAGWGAKLELYSGAQARHVFARDRFAWIGLGTIEHVDVLRIIWPDGLVQNSLDPPIPAQGWLRIERVEPRTSRRAPRSGGS